MCVIIVINLLAYYIIVKIYYIEFLLISKLIILRIIFGVFEAINFSYYSIAKSKREKI